MMCALSASSAAGRTRGSSCSKLCTRARPWGGKCGGKLYSSSCSGRGLGRQLGCGSGVSVVVGVGVRVV
eukprot:scaffold31075_cov59-Phaeocystis_antarctica.AAC.4